MWRRRILALGPVLVTLTLAGAAAATPPKRELPDYGGRGEEPATAEDAALVVPRVALFPVHAVTEYALRRPLGAAIAAAERAHLPEYLYDFFFFGPEHKAGFAPIAFVDFGFIPSIGVWTFWDDAGFRGHDLRAHGSIGTSSGTDWVAGSFTDRVRLAPNESLALHVGGARRPDMAFFGTGPTTTNSERSRYAETRLDANVTLELRPTPGTLVTTELGVRSVALGHGHFAGDPSVEQEAETGAFAIPYGFDRGYTAQRSRVAVALDSRHARPAPGSGLRLELEAEEGADVRRSPRAAWLRYSATTGAFLDLDGRQRVLSATVTTRFADPLGSSPVPFTELVSLGGESPMPGYIAGRLTDRSAAVATLQYRWPIWMWLDGTIQASTGNVFGEHLEKLDPSRLRFSGALGVESVGSRDSAFQLLVGAGTETLADHAKVDSVRITIGTNHGF